MDLSQETIRLLVFLAPGFLAFRIYLIDADWGSVPQLDIIYGSLVFSALSYACFLLFDWGTGYNSMLSFVAVTLVQRLLFLYFGRDLGIQGSMLC